MNYLLYKITNKLNGYIYIGVHETDNLNDGYMGSGKKLLYAIKKHGIENFQKEILEYLSSVEQMYNREKEVVTSEFVARHDTYNLMEGGWGGKITAESNEQKKKTMSERKVGQGEKNSQFGTMWITDGNKNTKIKKGDPIPENWRAGMKVPDEWGNNISKGLKGRTLVDILGADRAADVLLRRKETRAKKLQESRLRDVKLGCKCKW